MEKEKVGSRFRGAHFEHETVGELSLGEVHRLITGEKYKARTGHLRALADKGEARKYKAANFDYCTFSGVFGLRANHALVEHSGLLCMDLDHLSDVAEMKKRLLADPLFDTQLLFVSPSGRRSQVGLSH